ncbi:MAG: SDR family NAD(P)-dependent oxidoreductase [Myxococcales bacterium]|nr:SDR family NAD(P)-dependent oxidoreductase [Myxococcales bacterium]
MNELNDKVAIVTGGCGGIGLATVKAFLAEGARVMLVDLDATRVEQAVKGLDSSRLKGFAADVSKADQTAAYVNATVAAFGGLDILYANAGIEGLVRPIKDYPEAEFDKVLSVNVKGPFLGMKECVPHLEKRGGGSIVVTASIAGLVGSPGMAAYIVSKHALVGLVKVAAIEFGPLHIRVNAIAPGPVDNRMMRSLEEQSAPGRAETVKAGFTAQVPMGRYAKNEEIAQMALFLAGPRSSYSTGAVFLADGGFVTH